MNVNALKAKMVLNGDTIESLATKIGITSRSLGGKLNGDVQFKLGELGKIKELYKLSAKEFEEIFFANVVS